VGAQETLLKLQARFRWQLLENEVLTQLAVTALTTRISDAVVMEPWFRLTQSPRLGVRFSLANQSNPIAYLEVLVQTEKPSEHTLITTDDSSLCFDASEAVKSSPASANQKCDMAHYFMTMWRTFSNVAQMLDATIDAHQGVFVVQSVRR